MLREEGYEIVGEAGDGQEAVELAEQLKPDLVIMDVKMPRRDGIDAASEIASKRIAPIVVLTAFSQRDLVERARDAGAMAYLVKPFTISDLIPAIELALSRFSEVRALEREVETLSDRLETRKLVERAKGILQANQGMTEPEAFKWIQRAAMDRRTTMKHVAEVVLETLDTTKDASSLARDDHRRAVAEQALVCGDADCGALDLATGGLTAQLPGQLTHLGDRLGGNRLTEARQPA